LLSIPSSASSGLKGRRLLITGGGGFIGSHAVDALCGLGCRVRVFDRTEYAHTPPAGDFEIVTGNIQNLDEVAAAMADCDGVIHLAGISRIQDGVEDPLGCIGINVMGTANVLDAVRASGHNPALILASSEEVAITPTGAYGFSNLYGITKASAELCARRYAADFGQRTLALRFSAVYGSNRDRPDKVPTIFVRQALAGQRITVNGQGGPFDFLHIDDAVQALVLGLSHLEGCAPGNYEGFPICSGETLSLRQAAERIVSELGSRSAITVDPPEVQIDVPIHNDPVPAADAFGFSAKISFTDGIQAFAEILPGGKIDDKAMKKAGQ